MEDSATYLAALTLVHGGRTVAAADRYVRRHPWGSVLLAAGAAIAVTVAARGRHDGRLDTDADEPTADGRKPN